MDTHNERHRTTVSSSMQQHASSLHTKTDIYYITSYHTDASVSVLSDSISGFSSFSLCFSSTLLCSLPSSTEHGGFPCEIVAIQSICRYTNSELTTNNGSTRHVSLNVWYVLLCNPHVRTLLCFVCQRIAKAKENCGQKTS